PALRRGPAHRTDPRGPLTARGQVRDPRLVERCSVSIAVSVDGPRYTPTTGRKGQEPRRERVAAGARWNLVRAVTDESGAALFHMWNLRAQDSPVTVRQPRVRRASAVRQSGVSRASARRGRGPGGWPRRPGRTGGAGPAPRRSSPRAASPP